MPEPERGFLSLLEPVLREVGFSPREQQVIQLSRHYSILTQWNQRVNLTAIRKAEEIVERHFGESLFLAAKLPEAKTLVDVGSGAGFPGLPLAVARPEITVTLVESIAKKAVFLKEVAREMGNVRVMHARAEELHDHYEWAVCRAVSPDQVLPVLRNLADNVALLVSQGIASGLDEGWEPPIRLPWGDQRVLVMGRFEPSRST